MESDRSDILGGLIRKLGHSLEEIRHRTLRSLLSKLERNLISAEDLANSRELMANLLEWFNRQPVTEEKAVLRLLLQLSEHESAARTLADVGGVAFLSGLRTNLAARESRAMCERILEQLCALPPSDATASHYNCSYAPKGQADLSDASCPSEPVLPPSAAPDQLCPRRPLDEDQPTIGYFDRSSSSCSRATSVREALGGGRRRELEALAEEPGVTPASESCVKAPHMPWLPLPPTDRRVLAATLHSLKHTNSQVVRGAVDFARDVIFGDFPAEVFLQRTSIVKALLTALMSGELELVRPIAQALSELSRRLMQRIRYHRNPNNFCVKRVFSTKAALGTGMLRNYTPTTGQINLSAPELAADFDDIAVSASSQLSVPLLAVELVSCVVTLLGGQHPNDVHPCLIELLNNALGLLSDSLDSSVWLEADEEARDLVPRLTTLLERWGSLLARLSQRDERTAPLSGLTRQLYLGLLLALLKFSRALLPLKAALAILPPNLKTELEFAANDDSFMAGHPTMAPVLLEMAVSLEPKAKQRHEAVHKAGLAMTAACDFLSGEEGLKNAAGRIQMAKEAVFALHFVTCTRFVRRFVDFFADLCSFELFLEGPEQLEGRSVLLALLAASNLHVQKAAFAQAFDVASRALSVETAVDPTRPEPRRARFLLHRDVLFELATGGMLSANQELASLAGATLLLLLESRELMPTAARMALDEAVRACLACLQGHTDLDTRLGRRLLEFTDPPEDEEGESSHLDIIRAGTRLLFLPCPRVRNEAVHRLTWFLLREAKAAEKVGLGAAPATANWLIVDRPRALEPPPPSRGAYQAEGLAKVLEILFAESVEPAVRRSAGEQVSIFLQNPELHQMFTERGGVKFAVNIISRCVLKEQAALTPLLSPALAILRRVCQVNERLRAELAVSKNLLLSLIRVGLAFNYDSQCKYELSHLLVLLLFHEVSIEKRRETPGCNKEDCLSSDAYFQLPHAVARLFHLPFRCGTYGEVSACRPQPPDLLQEILASESSQRGLRIRWNAACNGGLEQLAQDIDSAQLAFQGDELMERMTLTELDKYFLHNTLPHLALRGALNAASNATAHRDVHAAISRLLLLLRASPGVVSQLLQREAWLDVFDRYLRVQPTVTADFELLQRVLELLEGFMTAAGPHRLPPGFRAWLLQLLRPPAGEAEPDGPLRRLLLQGPKLIGETDSTRLAEMKQWMSARVLRFYATAVAHIASPISEEMSAVERDLWQTLLGEVVFAGLSRLSLALEGCPFAVLGELGPAMELLTHASAQDGWASDPEANTAGVGLCGRLLRSYLSERDDAAVSYMGHAVLRCTMLLLSNLAVRLGSRDEGLSPELWLQGEWLPALLGFRSPEIRALALNVAVKLAGHSPAAADQLGRLFSPPDGPPTDLQGGIWGVAFAVLSDASEASSVRTQAAHLLTNLLSRPLPPSGPGPGVVDPQTGALSQGLDALLSLVEHWRLVEVTATVLNGYYPYPFVVSREVQSAARQDQNASFLSTASTAVLDVNDSLAATLDSLVRSQDPDSAPFLAPQRTRLLHSISAPALVSAVCRLAVQLLFHSPVQLLREMLELRLPGLLMNLLDPDLLEAYLRLGRYVPVLAAVAGSYASVLQLLRAFCLRDEACRTAVTADSRFCLRLVRLLALRGAARLLAPSVFCEAAWLVSVLLHPGPGSCDASGGSSLLTPLAARLPAVAASLGEALEFGGEPRRAAMTGLAALMASPAAHGCKLLQAMDVAEAIESSAPEAMSCGGALITQLIKAYDSLALRTQNSAVLLDKYAANNAMKTLLALSTSAKRAAIDMGLVESLIEYLKYLQNKLQIDLVILPTRFPAVHGPKQSRSPGSRELTFGYITDLGLTLDLLHNLVFSSPEAKQACVDAGLAQTIHRMWTLCQLDDRLLAAALRLLINFAANCPPAAASLALTSPLASGEAPTQFNASSLVQVIAKMAGGTDLVGTAKRENPVVLRLLYTLLANLMWSGEARGVLWKSKFLHRFSELRPKVLQRSKLGQVLQAAWLRLLLSLSFSAEGQSQIVRVPDSVNLLTEQASALSGRQLFNVLLIIRNLCCSAKVRPKLLAAECRLIPCLNRFVSEDNPELCLVVLSALRCLLFNSQKAKVSLKTEGFLQPALDLLDRLQSQQRPPEPLFSSLRLVLDAMRE